MKSEKSIAPYHPFIVGSARSGTTLLRMMLDSHPDMAIPPETHFIDALMQLNQDADNFYRDFCYKITGFFTWPDMEAYVSKSDFQQAIFKNADNLTFENGLKIFYDLYAKSQKKKYWGDKTPQYLLIMDKIEHLISDVAFIHIVRDVRDVCLSTSKVWFSKGSIDEHAFQWVESIKLAQLQSKKLNTTLKFATKIWCLSLKQRLEKSVPSSIWIIIRKCFLIMNPRRKNWTILKIGKIQMEECLRQKKCAKQSMPMLINHLIHL